MSNIKKFVFDEGVPKRIAYLEFDTFSSTDIRQLSHVEVAYRDLYKTGGNQPYPHGPLDSRLGSGSKVGTCATCGEGPEKCVGHFGFLKFSVPVFHFGVFKSTHFTLQLICKSCSRILLSEADRRMFINEIRKTTSEYERYHLLKEKIAPKCKRLVNCAYCHGINGGVKRVGNGLKLIHEKFKPTSGEREIYQADFRQAVEYNPEVEQYLSKAQEDLDPIKVLKLFQAIPLQDRELLQTPYPERFILSHFIVPPLCIRPSVLMSHGAGSTEDDLSTKLGDIISVNNFCKEALEEGKAIGQIMTDWEYLQFNTALYINSDHPGVSPPAGVTVKKIRALCQRLKGKHGRFRGNLSGKRVDFSGRTVISPDPNLRIDQVAVPIHIAKVMTYPEKVYDKNIEKLRKLIINGSNDYPGANYVEIAGTGLKKKLLMLPKPVREKIAKELKVGDIVERHMEDDDIVLFNRQPSLHKLSIMSHRARVMPWRTLRFNECCCTPYNADFDGDEMNLHLPQTEEARAEAWNLMAVTNNLITSRSGEPLIAAIQDFITASYLFSLKSSFFTKRQFTQLCCYMYDASTHIDLPHPTIVKPVTLWTGKQIFNVLLKPNKESTILINHRAAGNNCILKNELCPNDGFIVIRNSELMCGTMDKSSLGSGSKRSIFHLLLRDYGPAVAADRMSRVAKLCARFMSDRGFSIGIDDVQPSHVLETEKQKVMANNYSKCDELLDLWKNNKLQASPGCSIETTLEHKMNKELSDIRTDSGKLCLKLLHFTNSPLIMVKAGSKGSAINISQMVACVGQQTVGGLRVQEGFLDRTLPHFEFLSKTPEAKGFVKNSFYSGMTASEFFFHTMGGREGLVDTAVKTAETGYMARRLMKALEDLSVQYDFTVRNSTGTIIQFNYGGDSLDPANMEGDNTPLEFERVLNQALGICYKLPEEETLTATKLQKEIDQLTNSNLLARCSKRFIKRLRTYLGEVKELITKTKQEIENSIGDSNEEDRLTAKHVADSVFSITKRQLKKFVELCGIKFRKALMEPGTAVGALGAQSISEPGTQMTLKTFHFAGVASMNITQGVPRIKEIINASKNISTPIITAPLVYKTNPDYARVVKGRVERTTLGDVSISMSKVFDKTNCYIEVKLSLRTIRELQLHGITAETIRDSIEDSKIVATKDVQTRGEDTVNVYPDLKKMKENLIFYLETLQTNLPKVLICGIPSIQRAVISIIKEEPPEEYELVIEGDDLRSVMNIEGVQGTQATSNDVIEVQKVLGIEAARSTIIKEIAMTMKNHGIAVDIRHLMLLADIMTFKGYCLGIQRHGIQKMKDSVLMLASFEKTTDHLFDAAVYNREDTIEGVSECIIVGAPVPLGTGLFKLVKDNSKVGKKPFVPLLLDSPEYSLRI